MTDPPVIAYNLVGADGRQYGPVPLTTIRQWFKEGRVDGNTKVTEAGRSEWRPLSAFPEFVGALLTEKILAYKKKIRAVLIVFVVSWILIPILSIIVSLVWPVKPMPPTRGLGLLWDVPNAEMERQRDLYELHDWLFNTTMLMCGIPPILGVATGLWLMFGFLNRCPECGRLWGRKEVFRKELGTRTVRGRRRIRQGEPGFEWEVQTGERYTSDDHEVTDYRIYYKCHYCDVGWFKSTRHDPTPPSQPPKPV
jgi:hypothetical protein